MSESLQQQHARWLHPQGLHAIPVEANGKRPTRPDWQGTRHATADAAAAFVAGHTGNLGATMGADLVVFDQDRRHGVDGVAEFNRFAVSVGVAIPETLTAATPNNGVHSVFRLPAGVTLSNAVNILPGVDIRTAGGQIVVEPSQNEGRLYRWERNAKGAATAVAELPLPLALAIEAVRRSTPALAPTVGESRQIPEGSRNGALTRIAGGMRRLGVSVDDIEIALQATNAKQCDPPLEEIEVTQIARGMDRYAPAPATWELGFGGAPLPPGASPYPIEPMRPPRVSLADLESRPEPPHQFAIERILPRATLTLLGAHGGVGKSTLTLQAAACLVAGLPFMGLAIERCKVLFFSAEDPAPVIRRRLRHICRHMRLDPAVLDAGLLVRDATESPTLYNGHATPAFDALRLDVADFGPGVVIVDNASDVFDSNEIERARVREFVRLLASLGKLNGAAVLLLAHVDKATVKTGGSEGYSGSTAWHNSARSRLFLSTEGGVLKLEHQKSNLGPLADPIFMMRGPEGVLIAGQAPGGADDRALVLQLIADHCARGVTISPHPSARNNPFAVLRVDPKFPPGLKKDEFARLLSSLLSAG